MEPPFQALLNPNRGVPGVVTLNAAGYRRARAEITAWPDYAQTPLAPLPAIAAEARLAAIHIKDESPRFGLRSVKALGGAYAVLGVLRADLARRGVANHATAAALEAGTHRDAARQTTVCCATDGNHGRSVAWGAQRFGAACVVFVHQAVSPARIAAIAAYGAHIRTIPGTYDDSVHAAAETAEREGWTVVSDTSWLGYTEISREVMQGYRLMVDEALAQLGPPPTHVFIQAGVGGVAAAVAVQLRAQGAPHAALVVVEPERAACLLASHQAGRPTAVPGGLETIMAGLACGEPSLLAWQELDRSAAAFMAIPDAPVVDAMRRLARHGIESGESGAAGLAALLLAATHPSTRAAFALGPDSRVLLFNTEGATDPELYARLVP